MLNRVNLLVVFLILLFGVNTTFADLPGYTCKIYGKIIQADEIFIKPDCFKLTKIRILTQQNQISDFFTVTRYHDTCFKAYFYGGYVINDVLDIPQFIPDFKEFGKSYYFKLAESTYGNVTTGTGIEDKNIALKIPNDVSGYIPVDSIMTGYYSKEPEDFKNIIECGSYNIIPEQKQKLEKKEDTQNKIWLNWYSIILIFILGILFGYGLKRLTKE